MSLFSEYKSKEQLPLRNNQYFQSYLSIYTFQRKSYHYDYATFNPSESIISSQNSTDRLLRSLSKCMIRNWENLLPLSLLMNTAINVIITILSGSCFDSHIGGT